MQQIDSYQSIRTWITLWIGFSNDELSRRTAVPHSGALQNTLSEVQKLYLREFLFNLKTNASTKFVAKSM